ncbi:MAG: hypothetical protein F4X02_04985 [Chloroflexi bacterium]|nr:hypothetical protein [Chloroflexota bacterium]
MVTKTVFKQIRGFVIAWLVISALVCMATFLAVYFTYNPQELDLASGNPLPLEEPEAAEREEETLVLPSASPEQTFEPTPENAISPAAANAAAGDINAAATALPTPLPVESKRYQVGIQVEQSLDFSDENQDNFYRSVTADLGLRWIKQQVRWEAMETQPGEIDWRALDFILQSAQRFEVKLLLSVVTAPDWAREPGALLSREGPPADPHTYADFVAAIVKRYPGRVHAIEVWNEQNIDHGWTSIHGLNAANYVDLLRTTYEVVKEIDPGIIIISGGLAPTGISDGLTAFDDFTYLQQSIDAGVLNWADCIGAHHNGYNIGPDHRYDQIPDDAEAVFRGPFENPHPSWSFRSTLEGYANTIRLAGKSTKLCVTEFGWASAEDLEGARTGVEFVLDNTLAEQAEWISGALSNMEDWGFVWLAFIWNFNYGPHAGYDFNNDNVPYSLIGPGFKFRPAFDAIRNWQQDYLARAGH